MFKVGQKCICIVDAWFLGLSSDEEVAGPELGEVYTIIGITSCPIISERLILAEWSHPEGYGSGNFRPFVSTSKKSERQKIIQKLLSDGLKQPVEAGRLLDLVNRMGR